MIRTAFDRPVTFCVFLTLSFWPASILTAIVPSSTVLLDIVLGIAIAVSFTEAHARTSGRFRDAGAYFFWVYVCLITLGFTGSVILSVIGPSLVTSVVPDLFLEAAFVLVAYASAWWLVYEDGWARIRPLNWGGDGRSSSDG